MNVRCVTQGSTEGLLNTFSTKPITAVFQKISWRAHEAGPVNNVRQAFCLVLRSAAGWSVPRLIRMAPKDTEILPAI
jgi:hypothetical protein